MKIQIRGWQRQFVLSFFVLATVPWAQSQASRPDEERSLESCKSALGNFAGQHIRGFSSSILIPVGRLLAMRHLEYVAKLHVMGETTKKEHPTPGLAQMFLTASTAADSLIAHLDEIAVRPEYTPGDIVQGGVETLALMLSRQPKYIRDAVLIRDGVVMVVPLLERVAKGKFPDKKPVYRPVVVKGHQELEDSDILAASFAAWALAGPSNLGHLPETAKVFLKPMAIKRELQLAESSPQYESFDIHVRDHLPEVERLHHRYVYLISNPQELNKLPLRRNSIATKSSWFPYLRELMAEEGNLTMMPYPPKESELQALADAGVKNVSELAAISIHGDRFLELAMTTGIRPEKLRYFISHALAIQSQKPVQVVSYADPFVDADWLVHIDFEDFMERDVKSGVYLFGISLEHTKSRRRNRIQSREFIFAPMSEDPNRTITQKEVDEAWASFLRFFPEQFGEDLEDSAFMITVYSHHEKTKFNQQFDIVEADYEDFSPAQRSSRYFHFYEKEDGRRIGRLIRNHSFFRKYKDIKPKDIFILLDKMVDLLPFIRWNFSFPTHTNSLKYILDHIMPSTGQILRYPDGWNGLESIEWAKKAYQTGEEGLFERIRIYNEFDIDSNYFIADFIRRQSSRKPDPKLEWTDDQLEVLSEVGAVSESTRKVKDLAQKTNLLAEIMRRRVSKLSEKEREELEAILNRSEYLADRRAVLASEEASKIEKDQILQRMKYEFSQRQKHALIVFFEKIGGYERLSADDTTLDLIAELFLDHRIHELNPKSLHRMIAYDLLVEATKNLSVSRSKALRDRLKLPLEWVRAFERLKERSAFESLNLDEGELESLLRGIYFLKAFGH